MDAKTSPPKIGEITRRCIMLYYFVLISKDQRLVLRQEL